MLMSIVTSCLFPSLINFCVCWQSWDWELFHASLIVYYMLLSLISPSDYINTPLLPLRLPPPPCFRHHAAVRHLWGDAVWLELDGRGEHGSRVQPGQRRSPQWGQPGEHHQQRYRGLNLIANGFLGVKWLTKPLFKPQNIIEFWLY